MVTVSSVLELLAGALIHFVWQGALIGLFLALALNVFRSSDANLTAQIRHASALAALIAIIAAPLVTIMLLVINSVDYGVVQQASQTVINGNYLIAEPLLSIPQKWLSILLLAWAVGVTWGSCRLLLSWLSLKILQFTNRSVTPEWLHLEVLRLQRQAGIERDIKIVVSNTVVTPLTSGWLNPVLILPATMLTGLPADQLKLILLHELAHIRRCDYLVNWLQNIMSVLLFYHPVVHWVSRILNEERELCCDYAALGSRDSPLEYAKALLTLQNRSQIPQMALAAGGKGLLLRRLQRLLNQEADAVALSANPGRPFACLFTVLISGMVAVTGVVGTQSSQAAYQASIDAATRLELSENSLSDLNDHVLARLHRLGQISLETSIEPEHLGIGKLEIGFEAQDKEVLVSANSDNQINDHKIQKQMIDLKMRNRLLQWAALNFDYSSLVLPNSDLVEEELELELELQAEIKYEPVISSDFSSLPPRVQLPRPIHIVLPAYPSSVLRHKDDASVYLVFNIDSDGKPINVEVANAGVDEVLVRSAKRALKAWRFEAGLDEFKDTRIGQQFDFASPQPYVRICKTGSLLCRRIKKGAEREEQIVHHFISVYPTIKF